MYCDADVEACNLIIMDEKFGGRGQYSFNGKCRAYIRLGILWQSRLVYRCN